MTQYVKYPRTPHLPWSGSHQSDDIVLSYAPFKDNDRVVVTEKLDGENTTMYRDYIHARSIDSNFHWSRSWVKNFWSTYIRDQIPENMRIVGENMYATHSIKYTNLKSYFYGISIWEDDVCLDWDTTLENFEILGITPVPRLARGLWSSIASSIPLWHDGVLTEGYVIRKTNSFRMQDFQKSVAKYVRPNHVQTQAHWLVGNIDINELS